MSRLLLGTICGFVYGALSAISMLPLQFDDKTAALTGAFLNRFAPGSGSDHSGWLSPSELRLLSEWLDIGAQYFNNPFDPAVPLN